MIPDVIIYFRLLGGFGVVQIVILVPYLLCMKTSDSLTEKILMTLMTFPLIIIGIIAAIHAVAST